MKRRQQLGALVLLLFGCSGDPARVGPDPVFIDGDAGSLCAHPAGGCACSPEQPPIDCYLDPVIDDEGHITCSRGTRYCRGGAWTACEAIESYQLRSGPGIAALVTGPSACNMCDPACAVHRDEPDDADLPGNSTDIVYDAVAGGISIDPIDFPAPPVLTDTDGDGVPDVADECTGAGAFLNADGSCYGDTFVYQQLPYGYPAETVAVDHTLIGRSADIYFLVDTSGSMSGELANIKSGLTSGTINGCTGGVIGAVRCSIADSYFGLGAHQDYPASTYGAGTDAVYRNILDLTGDVTAAGTAINGLTIGGEADGPESQGQALWAIASGGGLGPYLTARTGCPAGTSGYACFRDGIIPVVVLFTDSAFHNGPSGNDYAFGTGILPPTSAVSGNDVVGSAFATGDAATTWTGWTGNTCTYENDYNLPEVTDPSPDVVFSFTISTGTTIRITTDGSSLDTVMALYNGSGAWIASDDDSGPGFTSQLTRTLAAGTYYLVLAGYQNDCGDYRLSLGRVTGFPVTWAQTVAELTTAGINVVTVHSGTTTDANALADATGSLATDGTRHVYTMGTDGSGIGASVADAIIELAGGSPMDVSARAVDDTATAVDETGFVSSITASGAPCSGVSGGTTHLQCTPGTTVPFTIVMQNDIVMPIATPQVFDFWIEIVGDGTTVLERIPVRVVVPATIAAYPPSAVYWRDYDSTIYCEASERPDWWELAWDAPSLPAGTSIRWELRTADTASGLATASAVSFVAPATGSPVDVGALLVGSGETNFLRHLRVSAVLLTNATADATPVLRSFEQKYICTPSE
jgi:hypothetical protein